MARAESTDARFDELLRSSWNTQAELLAHPAVGRWLLHCATPILVFGRWQTAQIATAGLNPSEREFCDQRGRELPASNRRFFHRASTDGSEPSTSMLAESRYRAEGYFELGNAYWEWFRGFQPLLEELQCTFESGAACHTDYVAPYATTRGIGSLPGRVRNVLLSDGMRLWRETLDLMPALRLIIGIGGGWRSMPEVFGFGEWDAIPAVFDAKGGQTATPRPYLLHRVVDIEGRPAHLFWWRPNRGEPLTFLSVEEKRLLANLIKERIGA